MPELSVVIITFNEEKNIARCLESVKDITDDIVVVDSFSTDKTEQICRSFNVNFIQTEWKGYSEQKNYANTFAKNDWIFSIDADEAISPELKESILEAKKNTEQYNYRIKRLTNYCGKWIKHGGWYPDTKLRFFDRRKNKWQGYIHERLNVYEEKKVRILKGDSYHYSYYTIEEHISQFALFATMSAENLYHNGEKVNTLKLFLSPGLRFIRMYFLKLGFLDGFEGLVIAKISAFATFFKYAKLKYLYAERKKS